MCVKRGNCLSIHFSGSSTTTAPLPANPLSELPSRSYSLIAHAVDPAKASQRTHTARTRRRCAARPAASQPPRLRGGQRQRANSAAKSRPAVIQGFTSTVPKQPHETWPDRPFTTETTAKQAKQTIAVAHSALGAIPESNAKAKTTSNWTAANSVHRDSRMDPSGTGPVANCQPLRIPAVNSSNPRTTRTRSYALAERTAAVNGVMPNCSP